MASRPNEYYLFHGLSSHTDKSQDEEMAEGIGRDERQQPDNVRAALTPGLDGRVVITIPEAARLLGVGKNTLYEAARRGEIPVLALGRRRLVPVAALMA